MVAIVWSASYGMVTPIPAWMIFWQISIPINNRHADNTLYEEEKQMQKKGRKIVAILGIISMLSSGTLAPQNSVQVQAATTAKKTVTVTLDKKHSGKCIILTTTPKEVDYRSKAAFKKGFKKNAIKIQIQILSLKGKPKNKITDFDCRSSSGTGALLIEFPPKKYKKGTIYKDTKKSAFHMCSADINIELPKGVKKVTYKITFSNISGKRTLKSVKVKNGFRHWY